MCGAFRLARFNVQRHAVDGRYFVGLPIPAAAAQIAALVHFHARAPLDDRPQALLALGAVIVALAFLMVSTLRYRSFKGFDLRKRRSYISLLGIALAAAADRAAPRVRCCSSLASVLRALGPVGLRLAAAGAAPRRARRRPWPRASALTAAP